ncbi:MAG TPA: hypothetical protein VF745_18615 [Steroidobacteraceae bacterium]
MDSDGSPYGGTGEWTGEWRREDVQVKTARQAEAELIKYCAQVAHGSMVAVRDQREANVLAVAARVLRRRFPAEIAHLAAASEGYLRAHEAERVSAGVAIANGWIGSLPRFRELLTRELEMTAKSHGRTHQISRPAY